MGAWTPEQTLLTVGADLPMATAPLQGRRTDTAHRRKHGSHGNASAHWAPRSQVHRPLCVPLPLIQVLLPHLRVRRGVLGLAGAVWRGTSRAFLARLCSGSCHVILQVYVDSTSPRGLGTSVYASALTGQDSYHELVPRMSSRRSRAGQKNSPERVDSVHAPRNAVNAPLRLFRLNPCKLSCSCRSSV